MTTTAEVTSAAELERQRLSSLAAQARARVQTQAQQAEAQTEIQAQQAISEAERQGETTKVEVGKEAEARQAQIRKQRGTAETQAQAAKAKARKAQTTEARKVVLPFTKPRNLGTVSYITSVEVARKQAHRAGEDAKAAVTKVRDGYFKQVDKARDDAITDIREQKAGIVANIQTQLINFNADITKQAAQLNSGVDEWEAESKAAIEKAQADYEVAIKTTLDRNGTEVFADMKDKGLIPANSIYDSYDKTTGQLNYTIPDTRSGEEIFRAEQAAGNIPPNATYKSYNSSTGEISYSAETPNFGSGVFRRMQIKGKIPEDATFISYNATNKTVTYFVAGVGATTIADTTGISPTSDNSATTSTSSSTIKSPQNSTNVVVAAAAAGAVMTLTEVGGTVAAIPTPPTWAIGGTLLVAALIIGIIERKRIAANIKRLAGKDNQHITEHSDAVVTNNAGTVAYAIQQFTTTPQTKEGSIETFPLEPSKDISIKDIFPKIEPPHEEFTLISKQVESPPFPVSKEPPIVIIRDSFDVPELRQKASNVAVAAIGVQTAANNLQKTITRELPITREQWNKIDEALRQGRITEGRRIIEGIAKKKGKDIVTIGREYNYAYEEYLRKKKILDAARKAYVASLNPQPIKGRGSTDATAAAIGVWLTQDIIQGEILKALNRGESMESAMDKAQAKIQETSKQLGLTQQQINAAMATVVYQAALSSMAQEAIKTASQAKTQGLTATQIEERTLTATKQAVHTMVQQAVDTHTITQTQARTLEAELDQVAEAVAELTIKLKLPELPKGTAERAGGEEYPKGTVVWNMGNLRGKGEEYKIIPPPYTLLKPITSFKPPKGMTKTKGTPQETLTFIGGKVPFRNVSFDLGITDGFIDVKTRQIRFSGEGEHTDVGTRIKSTTQGVALTDNPPLLHQLIKRGSGHHPGRQEHTKAEPLIKIAPAGRKTKLVSRGVYIDRGGTRLSRRPRRHWKRIY